MANKNIYDSQLDRMRELIGFGVKEPTLRENISSIERKAEGADGKVYGIIREGKKFYIKYADNRENLVAEDFDYIGGLNNKKEYEYLTYPVASKQFELKLMSINEAVNTNMRRRVVNEGVANQAQSEWQINETKEMRAEIERYKEIVNNVDNILKEDKSFTMNHTLPEAPAKNPSDKKVNAPFTDTATATLDKDLKATETNPENAGKPFEKDAEVSNSDMKSDKKEGGNGGDDTFKEKPKYVETGVAGENPKGGKVVRVEGKINGQNKTIILSEAQVLAWQKSPEFMDKTKGTEIGNSAPFNEKPETAVNEEVVDVNDVAGMDDDTEELPFPEVANDEDNEYSNGDLDFEEDYNNWLNDQESTEDEFGGDETDIDQDSINGFDTEYGMNNPYEGKKRNKKNVNETTLNDFGKHPAFQKVPMTTPPNKEVLAGTADKDWNDDSAKGEQPFGTRIGKSDPYTEKIIDQLTDSIMSRFKSQNKKKV